MAKALKAVSIAAGVAALAVVTGGTALGLGVALSTTAFGVSASALLATSALTSTAAALLTKGPKIPSSQTDRLTASIDPRAFRKTVLGQTAFPVDVRYEEWSGSDQEYCDWIVALASHAIDGIDEIWLNTEMAWSQATGVTAKYRGYFSVPNLILEGSPANAFSFASGRWDDNARLTGCAYARLRFKVTGNGKKAESPFTSGIPNRITIIGRGAKLYDPRRDSTVPGGAGPMRAGDQSTWRYTTDDGATIGENLPLQILRVVLGWRIRNPLTGEMKLATGSGVPAKRLALASWIMAANLADEQINRSAGGTEPRYHGTGVVSEGDEPKTALDAMCAACCARFRDTSGKLSIAIAHNDLANAATDDGLGDDDVVGGFTWDPDPSLAATPNVIRGRYVDASTNSLYQLIDYPEVRLPSPDGQDRVFSLDLGVVESPSQAQRVAKQVLQRKQYRREFTAPFDIRAWKYTVGDLLPFTFAPLSFARALFRVKEQELGQGGTCNMTLSVEHAQIYAFDRDDAAPVLAAEPIVYDASRNPLVLAIEEAGQTADWGNIFGPGKPSSNADVTADVLEQGRYALMPAAKRIGTERRARFDPIFWTTNFPNTMIAALRSAGDELRADAVFHRRDHLAGLIWESQDRFDHPTTAYDTDRDYRGCVLDFRVRLTGDVVPLGHIDGSVLTIEGREADGSPRTWYVRLANAVVSGEDTDARVRLDFDRLPGGFFGTDDVYAGDIDRLFISFVPAGYSVDGGRLPGPREGGMILSEMVATGRSSSITCGTGPGGVHEVRMANGYDDTYNVTPARIVRNMRLLGYKEILNHYVGMSHYFRWSWSDAEGRYVAEDVAQPLNTPCVLWHSDLATLLRQAGIGLIISLSYEMLDAFMPRAFRQLDSAGQPGLTGWEPPSSLVSPCNEAGMAYLERTARQFCGIAAAAGQRVHFQVGEPWYWVDFRTQVPCFYDPATTAKYKAETGADAPLIASMTDAMDAPRLAYLDWLGKQLAASILRLTHAVVADHADARSYALLYLPQVLNTATPELKRVNLPVDLAWPALDVLQLEDYDYVIDNRPDLSATGRAIVERRLGYPRSKQEYFAGFALFKDTGQIWRGTTNALQAAYDYGVGPVYVWAYTQVLRDGYVPLVKMAPAPAIGDLADVFLPDRPADGDVLFFDLARRRWVPGKPWLT